MKEYTLEELHQNNGTDGKPALVAANGRIWDVTASKMWQGGKHMNSHSAGEDLSVALEAAPHGADVLDRFDEVGSLATVSKKNGPKKFPEPSPLIKKLLDQHPHPISAHFPIGLGIAASFFAVVSLFLDIAGLNEAAFYNLLIAAATAPACIVAGLLSWYYNYGGIWTNIFKTKAALSALLLTVLGAAIALKVNLMTNASSHQTLEWVYTALVAFVAPNVTAIGRLGGKITFPS